MKANAIKIEFRPITVDDLALLRQWMETPHWREWWESPEKELELILKMIEGRDTTRPFIFLVDGEPVGYIQYYFVGHQKSEKWLAEFPWLAELPEDAMGVDLSIGPAEMLSKGIGSAVLKAFTENLAQEGYKTIIIDPDTINRRAIRAYEKAGYRPIPALEGRTGDATVMQYELN